MSVAHGGGSPAGVFPTATPGVIPPLDEQGTPSSGVVRRPLFARDGPSRSPRSQPSPPAGPPPKRPPPGMAEALDMKLPGISPQSVDAGPLSVSFASSSHENSGGTSSHAETKRDKRAGTRIDSMGRHAQMSTTLVALPESEDAHPGRGDFDGLNGTPPVSPLGPEVPGRAEPRLSAEIALAARKAQRVAEVRNIAQEVARVPEDDVNAGADEKERGEIERCVFGV